MFDRFTDDAKRALSLARRAALRFGHDYIGTEHMLLGLCATAENPACRILRDLGAEPQSVCDALEPRIPPGSSPDADVLPFAPRAKLALEQAMFGASEHGYRWIDPSHLLLGVVRVTDGLAARVLAELGVTADAVNEGVRAQRPDDAQVVDDVVAARFADSEPERGAARLVRTLLESAVTIASARRQTLAASHVLLALLDWRDSVVGRWLVEIGVDPDTARRQLVELLDEFDG